MTMRIGKEAREALVREVESWSSHSSPTLADAIADILDRCADADEGGQEPMALATDDDVEVLARRCGWDNRRYMTPSDYAEWCRRMRQFAALARPPVGLPADWVAVPVKMTQDMAESAKAIDGRLSVFKWDDGYRAALSAAPTCPGVVSLPDGFPWTPDTCRQAKEALWLARARERGGNRHNFCAALASLARWIEAAGEQEVES